MEKAAATPWADERAKPLMARSYVMRVAVIVNPVSGARRHRPELRATLDKLRSVGVQVEILPTRAAGDAETLARLATQRAQTVIAAGGDGTVREVAGGLADSGVPLIVWPAGTENLVAKTFGYRASADSVYAALTAGRRLRVDLARHGRHAFLVVAGVGFDAEVVQRLTRLRNGHITHLSYAGPIWRTFWQHRFPHVQVTGDQFEWQGRGLVFVGNIRRYSLGLRVIRDAVWDDGWLDVIIFPCRHQLDLIGHSLRTLFRRQVEHPGVRYRRVRRVRVESDEPVPVQLDGDDAGCLPLDVQVAPQAVTLLVPPDFQDG